MTIDFKAAEEALCLVDGCGANRIWWNRSINTIRSTLQAAQARIEELEAERDEAFRRLLHTPITDEDRDWAMRTVHLIKEQERKDG
jgi:hypothetical protein